VPRVSGLPPHVAGTTGRALLPLSLNDADAFADFYGAYVGRVSVFFVKRVFDTEIAVDLTAEAFAIALERRRQFRGTSSEEEQGWLFAIARSLLQAYWRKGQIEQAAVRRLGLERLPLTDDDIRFLHDRSGLESLRDRLAEALTTVRPDQAAAVRARVIEEREYADIAADFGTTQDVIRARVSRGLKTMHALLGNSFYDAFTD
jgi:RNA polymerase sigma-70 factor (ECF subfamily)